MGRLGRGLLNMWCLGFIALIAACGGGSGGEFSEYIDNNTSSAPAASSSSSQSQDGQVNLSGRLTYDFVPLDSGGLNYSQTEERPIRGAVVNLVDAEGSLVQTQLSDDEGRYQFSVATGTQVKVQVEARSRFDGEQSWTLQVEDNTRANALYRMEGEVISVESVNTQRDLHAPSGWTGDGYGEPRAAAPFAILDTAWEVLQHLREADPQLQLPAARFRWSPNNAPVDGLVTDGDIGTSYYDGQALYILGAEDSDTDEYDRHIIAHEWAHFLEDSLARIDTIGGPHAQGEKLDMRVAYSEGVANALAGFTLDDPLYFDSVGVNQSEVAGFDIAQDVVSNPGWFSESSIQAVFYHWLEKVGITPFYEVITDESFRQNSALVSVFLFADVLSSRQADNVWGSAQDSAAAEFFDLYREQRMNSRDRYGAGERNNGATANVLPLYLRLQSLFGQSIEVCSSQKNGSAQSGFERNFNKLGVHRFVRFRPMNTAVYEISVEQTQAASTNSDPDIEVYRRGGLVARGFTDDAGSESLEVELEGNEEYILSVYDYADHPAIGQSAYQPSCFNLSVSLAGGE
ncbi:carboxypeptidase-like regulatory domain-containing protein [Gilvimarinus xylanilyticus]|uniref:Carboxypeptidase-like regulatory domain-containing protein n=1 Tax=Gilvimarinus xylanilyticus TaxID=2944139 RepID=A0A9X2I1F3_9GAMM|nr:carboxypeptidase-like regulatory domain-containing protein [Gilvimarinus xylanilyticus]MCP8898580.1 carboxypeptidase-like regulatory domain-containing protein [Gilvimarinus xylanilyticus]